MLRSAIALTLLLVPIVFDGVSREHRQSSARETKEKSCRAHPQLIGRCFNVRGRLSTYNGAPALRIWRVGTRRMLGISEQRFSVAGYRNVPADIESQLNQDVAIFGDFLVCPFTRSRPGEMQLVCIEAGKNLVVRKQFETRGQNAVALDEAIAMIQEGEEQ